MQNDSEGVRKTHSKQMETAIWQEEGREVRWGDHQPPHK